MSRDKSYCPKICLIAYSASYLGVIGRDYVRAVRVTKALAISELIAIFHPGDRKS